MCLLGQGQYFTLEWDVIYFSFLFYKEKQMQDFSKKERKLRAL